MKKEWFFDRNCGQQFVALSEDGRLMEFAAERENNAEIVGNIYKGRVANVLAGMQAAFIDCGLARNCYLSTDDCYADCSKYDVASGASKKNSDSELSRLKEGDEIIVQVTKPPRGNKGAKVTTRLSFVGKNLIYLSNTDFLGISRKILDEAERERLLQMADKMRSGKSEEGFIVRTHALTATKRQLKTEAEYLKKLYLSMQEGIASAKVGDILYREEDLCTRIMRDSMGDDVAAIHVSDKNLYEKMLRLIRLRGDISERRLMLYTGEREMFYEYGIADMLAEAAKPTVALENGGYLVVDHTEAMTVIDVNTGSFVGNTEELENTVLCVNLEAAAEIARQVRLRNIGGIVVVDFIDMTEEAHKEKVTAELIKYLGQDKAKCRVLPMSELCLTQFTRKRVGSEVSSYLYKPCPHCKSRGHVLSDVFLVVRIRAEILNCFADGYNAAIIELNEGIMREILSEHLLSEDVAGAWKDKRVYMIPHKTYEETQYTIRGDNSGVLHLPDKAQILY